MFITDPVNFGALADRRKKLLQRLSSQLAGRPGSAGVGARMGMAAFGRPFKAYGDFRAGPMPMITRPFAGLPPGLAELLGPGGMSRPLPAETSSAPGRPIDAPVIPGRSVGGTPLTSMGLVGLPDPMGRPINPGPPPTHGGGLIPLQGGLMLDPISGQIVNPNNLIAPNTGGGTITGKGAVI